ncbi:unnamed protein product [Discosporangium mesarthrocarpum]
MQLNRNPSLVHLTSANVHRSASFVVDKNKSAKEVSRKKNKVLKSCLHRVAKDTGSLELYPVQTATSRARNLDIEMIPDLEPYRREFMAQKPISFGHRPRSASRMFNPTTMATSCHGQRVRASLARASSEPTARAGCGRGQEGTIEKRRRRRSVGLSAYMLKELLFQGNRESYSSNRNMHALQREASKQKYKPSNDAEAIHTTVADHLHPEKLHGDDDHVRESLSMSDPVREHDGKKSLGVQEANWLSKESKIREEHRLSLRAEDERELRRVFSDERPAWDDSPAPIPTPCESRRAVSELLMPDPDERICDKLAKTRKAAAGVPSIAVMASGVSAHEDPVRWEPPPVTPRARNAEGEIRRLMEERRTRDEIMAHKVGRACYRVHYQKIAGSERAYQRTLAQAKLKNKIRVQEGRKGTTSNTERAGVNVEIRTG